MGLVSLVVGYWYWSDNPTAVYNLSWGTIVFTVLTLSQMGHALAVRASRESLFKIGLLSNVALLGSVSLTLALQLAVIYVPFLQRLFQTRALSLSELAICFVLSTIVFWAVEAHKLWMRLAENSRKKKPRESDALGWSRHGTPLSKI